MSIQPEQAVAEPTSRHETRPRVVLVCHHDAPLDHDGMARWLDSFCDLAGIVVIEETADAVKRRVRRELKRVGPLRMLDVVAFRLYYRLLLQAQDKRWQDERLAELRQRFAEADCPTIRVANPNSREAEQFIAGLRPDIVIARSKFLLKPAIFRLASRGTFVMHPGICPEYRNAHGCFWALAEGDTSRVGLTLLKIDEGIDTGPVYGYFGCDVDEVRESHARVQTRIVLDNLDAIAAKLLEIHDGAAKPVDTRGRASGVWGQPWLSRHLAWKWRARRRRA